MSQLVELQKKRIHIVQSMRKLVDGVDASVGMSSETTSHFNNLNDSLNDLDELITVETNLNAIEESMHELADKVHRSAPNSESGNKSPFSSTEYHSSYEQFVRNGLNNNINAVLTVGTDSEGGFTVPELWADKLIKKLTDQVVMRQLATVIHTENDKNLPLVSDNGSAGWVDEKGVYPESQIVFDSAKLGSHKLGRIIKISEELLQDTGVDLVSEIADVFGRTFGEAEELAFFRGTGVSQPTGIMTTAMSGKVAASPTAITYDEIIDLEYSVREIYRKNATWVMHPSTAGMLRKMKSSDGVPLWQPSLQASQPDMFSGKPLRTTIAIQAVATGVKCIAYGDYREYRIADRGNIYIQRLDELFAAQGMVGFKTRTRVDGILAVPEAVKTLTMA